MPRKSRSGRKKILPWFNGILTRNPILVSGMLIAPVVVASTSLKNAAALSITLAVVTIPTMLVASIVKTRLPHWLRIPMYALVAALLLIPATFLVTPIAPNIFDSMGMYFILMVFNSILFTRSEKFALKHSVLRTLLDGVCYSLGFALAIGAISAVRELLVANTLWGVPIELPFKISAVGLPFAGFLLVAMFAGVGRYTRDMVLRLVCAVREFRRKHALKQLPPVKKEANV